MSTSVLHNEQRIQEFLQEGLLAGLIRSIENGLESTRIAGPELFSVDIFSRRVIGQLRWNYLDQALYDLAPRFSFEPRRVLVGNGFPEMFMIQRENIVLSIHSIRLKRKNAAPKYAAHRERLMPPPPVERFLLSTPQAQAQIQEWESQQGPMELWTATYHVNAQQQAEWITLGRPARGQKTLFFYRDLRALVGELAPMSERIVLNDPQAIPTINIKLPSSAMLEGEGEQ